MAKLKAVLLTGAIVAAGATAYAWMSDGDEEAARTRNLVNQIWIERMPDSQRDMIGHFALIDKDGHQIGGIGRSSTWRHAVELFGWRRENNRVSFFFPQDRVRAQVKARTWRCAGEAPEPFDLCLEMVTQDDRSIRLYSRKDWVIKDGSSLESLAADNPELAHVFDAVQEDVPSFELDEDAFSVTPLSF